MYRRNYLFRQYPNGCFTSEKPFMIEVPRPGKYKITITLKSDTPLGKVAIHTGSDNLAFMESIPAGVFKHITIVNVGSIVPDGWDRVCQDRVIPIIVNAESDCLSGLSVSEVSCPTIYIASSHVSDSACLKWKQMLTAYTDHKIAVSDHSRAGLNIESFRQEGHYGAINEYSRPGDFYFFQFDPSSQSVEDWMSGGRCRRQLARYIIECRDRLAYPVLLTSTVRYNTEEADDYIGQLWKQYLDAYREISNLTATPLIELHKLHDTSCDAYVTAGLVAQEIARICGTYPERGYRFLAKCMSAASAPSGS